MNTRISTLLGLALVTVTSFARADETVASPEPVRHEVVRSYAWQTLLVDGSALGLMVTGLAVREPAVTWTGVGSYALGPAIVHVTHGNVANAVISGGMRIVGPPLLGAAGFGVGWAIGGADWGGLLLGSAFAFVGVLGGYVGAVAVDAGVLAKETVPAKATGLAIVPTFQATSQSARLGFAGQF